jgi:hypothetical protein
VYCPQAVHLASKNGATARSLYLSNPFRKTAPLLLNLMHEFFAHPQGKLGTVYLRLWLELAAKWVTERLAPVGGA